MREEEVAEEVEDRLGARRGRARGPRPHLPGRDLYDDAGGDCMVLSRRYPTKGRARAAIEKWKHEDTPIEDER